MKLSIITPVFNREDCIPRCIESVIGQCSMVEHWLVDDGSTDETLKIIQKYKSQYNHISSIVFDENKGVNAARNAAIKQCSGDFILFLDSDDWLEKNAVSTIIDSISANKGYLHYLFGVSSREEYYLSNELLHKEKSVITFKDWLLNKVLGDFFHVMNRNMLLMFPFNENIRIYESVNFLRIYKYSQKQLFINRIVVGIEHGRSDSVSLQYQLINREAMHKQSIALETIINNFSDDYIKANATHILENRITKYLYLALATGNKKGFDKMVRLKPHSKLLIIRKANLGILLRWAIMAYSLVKNSFNKVR